MRNVIWARQKNSLFIVTSQSLWMPALFLHNNRPTKVSWRRSSGGPTPHCWTICYWKIHQEGDSLPSVCAHKWSQQSPTDTLNTMTTQVFLVKLNGSQSKPRSHGCRKVAGGEGGARVIREDGGRIIKMHYTHMNLSNWEQYFLKWGYEMHWKCALYLKTNNLIIT